MNIIQKFKSLDRVSKCAVILFGTVATIYGGSKHTNNVPPMLGAPAPYRACLTPGMVTTSPCDAGREGTPGTVCLTNWHTRGAWIDWAHIDLPSSFRFPRGTNFINSVTLMSNGELRTALRPQPTTNNQQPTTTLAALPQAVSLEPDVTTVTHGLTPSNTYLFAWQDACVNRDATNRTDASIELFPNGSIATTFGNTVERVAPYVPEGFVGEGQNEDWVRANFALFQSVDSSLTNVEQILSVGYQNWLTASVGVNAPNGRYQAAVTISSLPTDMPYYLVSGPYKVVLTQPGTYRFPFMVFSLNETRTYPDALPHTIEYDDGYTCGDTLEFEPYEEPALFGPRLTMSTAISTSPAGNVTKGRVKAKMKIEPKVVDLAEANGKYIRINCNLPQPIRHFQAIARDFQMSFIGYDKAQLLNAATEDFVEVVYTWDTQTCHDYFTIEELNILYPTNRFDSVMMVSNSLHVVSNEWGAITYFTVGSQSGSMAEVRRSTTVEIPAGHACYVGAFMATFEQPDQAIAHYDDIVGWNVTAAGNPPFAGRRTVFGESMVGVNYGSAYGQYGVKGWEHLMAARRFAAPAGESLTLNLEAWAQNVTDDINQTCIQLNVYPEADDGEIIGWPDWAPLP